MLLYGSMLSLSQQAFILSTQEKGNALLLDISFRQVSTFTSLLLPEQNILPETPGEYRDSRWSIPTKQCAKRRHQQHSPVHAPSRNATLYRQAAKKTYSFPKFRHHVRRVPTDKLIYKYPHHTAPITRLSTTPHDSASPY